MYFAPFYHILVFMYQILEKLIYWKMFELPFPSYLLEESVTDIGYADIG